MFLKKIFPILFLILLTNCTSVVTTVRRNKLEIPNFIPSDSIEKSKLKDIMMNEENDISKYCFKKENTDNILYNFDLLIRENSVLRENMKILEEYYSEINKNFDK